MTTLLVSGAFAADEVKVRPTVPKLYLTEAGNFPAEESLIPSFTSTTICPDDYKNGFSFRCETKTGPNFPLVVFRVNGKVYQKQRKAPYYLQGDTPKFVRKFLYEDFRKKIRITCRVRTRKAVWVDILVKC